MKLGRAARVWLTAYVVVSLVDLVAQFLHRPVVALVALALAMPTLLGFLLTARPRDRLTTMVAIGLVFSWCGDMFGAAILIKIAFFLIAQLCYAAAFWPYRARSVLRRRPLVAALYGVAVLIIIIVVAPPAGVLAPAVIIYAATIGSMAVLATGISRATAVGAAIFIASDTIIALTTFVVPGVIPLDMFWIMATYLTAQLLIVLGVVRAPAPMAVPPATVSAGQNE
jgi:uncharacterized membrane protein YhhN